MNKLIKELSEQAMVDVDYIRFTEDGDENEFLNDELSKMYIPDFFAERFAELIVREYLRILKHDECIQKLKEKFGMVEDDE